MELMCLMDLIEPILLTVASNHLLLYFLSDLASLDEQAKTHEGEQGVEYKQLVTEMIAVEPSL